MLGVLFFLFSLAFIWRNFYDILVFVNGVYLNVKDWYLKNDFNYNFKPPRHYKSQHIKL